MNIDELYECAKNLATVLSTNHMQSEASKILKVIDTEDSPYEWVPKLETIVDKISIENIPKSSKSALIDVLVAIQLLKQQGKSRGIWTSFILGFLVGGVVCILFILWLTHHSSGTG